MRSGRSWLSSRPGQFQLGYGWVIIVKVGTRHFAAQASETVAAMEIGLARSPDRPCPDHEAVSNSGSGSARPAGFHTRGPFSRLLPGCECGASSGEFAFAIMVLAVAIVVGGLGGIWIAKREGLQKPKAPELPQATEQPLDQPAEQPGEDKAAEAPSKAPSLKASEVKSLDVRPAPKPAGPQLPSVAAIHYSSQAGTTEVTIELGAASLVRAAGLPNPERVYFDLQADGQSERPHGSLDAQNAMDVGDDALLAGIRVARWKSGNMRVVLDLKRPCEFSYRLSPQPASRLIVELKARADGSSANAPEIRKND